VPLTRVSLYKMPRNCAAKSVAEQGDGHGPLAAILRQNTLEQCVSCTLSGIRACYPKKRSRKDKLSSGVPYRTGWSHWLLHANEAGANSPELTLSTATEKLSGVMNGKGTSEYQGSISYEMATPGRSMAKIFRRLADFGSSGGIVDRVRWPLCQHYNVRSII
jgi:hypothetical protein